jgi:hypothetical protein
MASPRATHHSELKEVYKYLGIIKTQIQNPALPVARMAQDFLGFTLNYDHLLSPQKFRWLLVKPSAMADESIGSSQR